MSASYCADRELTIAEESIFDIIHDSIKRFRESYPATANKFYQENRAVHQQVIYSLLDRVFDIESRVDSDIDNKITEGTILNSLRETLREILRSYRNQTNAANTLVGILIERNYNQCVRRCDRSVGIAERPDISDDCLIFCSLDYLTSYYVDAVLAYERCSEALGAKTTNLKFNEILTKYPLQDGCRDIHRVIIGAHNSIDEVLSRIQSPQTRAKWLELIDKKLDAARRGQMFRIDYDQLRSKTINPIDALRMD